MKIDTNDYLTAPQAAKAMGANTRAIYRASARAIADGHETFVTILGRSLLPKAKLAVLQRYYFPNGSDRRAAMAEQWGRRGGEAKRDNAVKRAATSRRSSRGTSGTAAEGR